MTLANLKSTQLCYTKELVDALVELHQAFKGVNTEPGEVLSRFYRNVLILINKYIIFSIVLLTFDKL